MKNLVPSLLMLAYAGELVPADVLAGGQLAAANGGDDMFDNMIAGKWLPRVQLMTSNSAKCKSGEFPINNWACIVGNTFKDLGKNPDILILVMRYKAVDTSGESILSVYDPKSPEWAKIADKADNTQDSGCMYGPEFLIYVPALKKFASLLMGTKSARKESPDFRAKLGKAATLGFRMAENKKYSWAVPICTPCSTPFEIPALDEIKSQVEKFMNPPASEVEEAPADSSGRER